MYAVPEDTFDKDAAARNEDANKENCRSSDKNPEPNFGRTFSFDWESKLIRNSSLLSQ